MFTLPLFTLLVFCCRKLDAQVRAAVEMYSEDWVIVRRRWVYPEQFMGGEGGSKGCAVCGWFLCLSTHYSVNEQLDFFS